MSATFESRRTPAVPFHGIRGRALAGLLQLGVSRYHRVQLGFIRHPDQYEAFLAEVVQPRLASHAGRLGIFGAGSHTEIALRTMPALRARAVCLADNNAALWHQTRFDTPVLPPAEAVEACDVFFLSTAVFQAVFRKQLRALGFRGATIGVDDHVPPSWFLTSTR